MNGESQQNISFAEFELDPARRRLLCNGKPLALYAKTLDLLVFLLENNGRIVSKDEILETVWAGQFVEEANLSVQISALRKALGEKKDAPRFLVTVPGKGYKFVADIQNNNNEIIIERHKISRLVVEETNLHEIPVLHESPSIKSFFSRFKNRQIAAVILLLLLISIVGIFLLWRRSRPAVAHFSNLRITKLTTSGKVVVAALSPDGKFAVFAQKETDGESLWLRQIQTGSQTRILAPQKIQFVGLTVSPDNNFVYASVFFGNRANTELQKIPLLGGAAETIPNIVTGTAISFSPDGRKIAFTGSHSPETFLKTADADGKNERILLRADGETRSLPIFDAEPIAWSPDGAEIACVVEEKTADGERAGILLVNPANGDGRYLIKPRWAFIGDAAWLDKENLALVVYESDEYKNHIYLVSRSTGEFRRLTNDTNGYSWLSTANGDLMAVQRSTNSSLFVADNFGSNTAATENLKSRIANSKSPDLHEISSQSDSFANVVWALDGSILYSSSATGKREIWRVQNDGSNPQPLTVEAEINYGLSVSPADGSMVFGSTRGGTRSIWLADANGKNLRQITNGADDLWADFAPDGQTIFFQRGFDNNLKTIWRVAANGGKPTQLTTTTSTHPKVSPDGKQIAYFIMDSEINKWRISLISAETGILLQTLDFPDYITERRLEWHPSGKFLTLAYTDGDDAKLLLLPIDGGTFQFLTNLSKGEISSFAWSPDGQKIVFARHAESRDVVLFQDSR